MLAHQAANTDFVFRQTPGSIIHPDDVGKIKVSIGYTKTAAGQTTVVEDNARKPVVDTFSFEADKQMYPSAIFTAEGIETNTGWAVNQNNLEIRTRDSGERLATYNMTATFPDTNTTTSADGRYELSVTGNDLDGWTVTLSSNIQAVAPEAPTVTPATGFAPDSLGTVNIPQPQDPANPIFTYTQEQVDKNGNPSQTGTYVRVTATLANTTLYVLQDGAQTEWLLDVSGKATKLVPAIVKPKPADKPAPATPAAPAAQAPTKPAKLPKTGV